ncbi:MAG: L,D-transpeptidase family protein [Bdellovibrionaceae bacterium]|nr:L,D-transpeptidase family protein [Pseudobdellovibrionaceae bacterium]
MNKNSQITFILFLSLFLTFGSLPGKSETSEKKSTSETIDKSLMPEQLLQIASTKAFAKYVFLVDKSLRTLFLYEREDSRIKKVGEFPADIGKNGGNKMKENDHRTPEGIYFFQHLKKPPEIPFDTYGKMAFTMDYPNIFDMRTRKTGSGIWLHSIPDSVPLTRGSRGCVVVRNDVIEKLTQYIQLKETPILIFDQIKFVATSEHEKKKSEIHAFINGWREAWQSKSIDKYIDFYDEGFKSLGYNKKRWKKYKEGLIGKYEYINVSFDQPFLLIHNDQLIIKTLQKYQSNKHTDFGIKTIHALKIDGNYKIISEDWKEANPEGFEITQKQADQQTPTSAVQDAIRKN